jgi:hypothetical protein
MSVGGEKPCCYFELVMLAGKYRQRKLMEIRWMERLTKDVAVAVLERHLGSAFLAA